MHSKCIPESYIFDVMLNLRFMSWKLQTCVKTQTFIMKEAWIRVQRGTTENWDMSVILETITVQHDPVLA